MNNNDEMNNKVEKCLSCSAVTPLSTTGITHAYLGASSGCWARFGEVLAREYADLQYFAVHPLTVDAYAVQHPGKESPQTVNSINLHLASLHAYYRNHLALHELAALKGRLANFKSQFQWLEPPEDLGELTVNEVWAATTAQEHRTVVLQWGEIMLECWHKHDRYIAALCRL